MKVRMLDPIQGNAKFQRELEEAAIRVLRSGKYILDEEVKVFEEACAKYLGVKYAIGMSSGTDALIAALLALRIEPGDEIICPSFTFFATAGAIARIGAIPVFVDIRPDCFTIDYELIEKAITCKTKAIIPVHLFGQPADMNSINNIAQQYELSVIEDACQAFGAALDGRKVGSLGQIGCFSFFPSKNLGGFGDGGLAVTNNDMIAHNLRMARNHGMGSELYHHEFIGGNFRLDAIQAALLNIKLKYLDEIAAHRGLHAAFYDATLNNTKLILPQRIRGEHVWNQYTVRLRDGNRNQVKEALAIAGVSSAVYYPKPLHCMHCFNKNFSSDRPSLFETQLAAQEVLSLPIAAELDTAQLSYVVKCLKDLENKSYAS